MIGQINNFEDFDKDMTSKLSDDEVGLILECIDARNKLQTLRLAGCVSISGRGLEALGGSTILKHVDLSLA